MKVNPNQLRKSVGKLQFNCGNVICGGSNKPKIVSEQETTLMDGRKARLIKLSNGEQVILPLKR